MKTNILSIVGILLLLFISSVNSQVIADKNTTPQKESVTVSCSPDLYPIASQWASEYNTINPESRIEVINPNGKNINPGEGANLSFATNLSSVAMDNGTNWKIVVGRDIIVPFVNSKNPYLVELTKQGVSQEKFAKALNNSGKQNWGMLVAGGEKTALHIYMVNDETVKAGVAKFLQSANLPISGIIFGSKDEVVSAVQNDPSAIGFCSALTIMAQDHKGFVTDVKILPIDKNGNGTIDYMEDIYSDANSFLRGVWIGKYPKSLYSNIFAVSKTQPANETEIAFLTWVLADGQQYLNPNGFCSMVNSESQSQLSKISPVVVNVNPTKETSATNVVLMILAIVIILGFVIGVVIRRNRKQVNVVPDFNQNSTSFDESSVSVPNGLYFDRAHTWAFMEKDGNIAVGIDDFLQHITGPITRVEMKSAGEKIKKGDLLFSIIQKGKQLNLYAPVSGVIKKQNEALIADSSLINKSPYTLGWIYMIEPSNWFKEIQLLEMAVKYRKWINTEFSRVKDFIAANLKPDSLEYAHVVLQDGGALKDGILTDFGPEVWDDFQTNFLDTYK